MFKTSRQLIYTPEQLDQFLNDVAAEGRHVVAYREFYRPYYSYPYGWFYAIEAWITTAPLQIKALPEQSEKIFPSHQTGCQEVVPPHWDTGLECTSETCHRPLPCIVHDKKTDGCKFHQS